MRTAWSPLPVLAGITRVATWITGIGAMAVVIANISALGWLPGTSPGPSCVDTGGLLVPFKGDTYSRQDGTGVCTDSPDFGQRLADLGDQVPQVLFAAGALILLLRFLSTASREGPYADSVPGKLAALGWLLLLGGPLSEILAALSTQALRHSLIDDIRFPEWYFDWQNLIPWWSIAAGITALTFAHILRIGTRMREDLEGTV